MAQQTIENSGLFYAYQALFSDVQETRHIPVYFRVIFI